MSEFSDWELLRAALDDGDDTALETERERTMAWTHAFRLVEERKRLGLTQCDPESAPSARMCQAQTKRPPSQ